MCVRGVDDLCVLQFTLIIAAGCALHRRTSRVIHRIELYFFFFWFRKEEGTTSHLLSRRALPEEETAKVQATRDPSGPTRRRRQIDKTKGTRAAAVKPRTLAPKGYG